MKQRSLLRLAFAFILLAVMVWLPVEDTGLVWGLILAAAMSGVLGAYWYIRISTRPYMPLMIGALAGAAAPLLAAVLMLVKTGLHGHAAPDYTWFEFLAVLRSTPVWFAGGALVGAGIALQLAVSHRNKT